MIEQFGRKMCQKKRKDVDYKLLLDFFQKYFVKHERSAVKNTMYIQFASRNTSMNPKYNISM